MGSQSKTIISSEKTEVEDNSISHQLLSDLQTPPDYLNQVSVIIISTIYFTTRYIHYYNYYFEV